MNARGIAKPVRGKAFGVTAHLMLLKPGKKKKLPYRRKKRTPYIPHLYVKINQKYVRLSSTGIKKFPDLTWNELSSMLDYFYDSKYMLFWAVADLYRHMIEKFGVTVNFVSRDAKLDFASISHLRKCAQELDYDDRSYLLHPRVQRYIFSMDDKDTAREIIRKAEKEGWSFAQIREVRELFAPAVDQSQFGIPKNETNRKDTIRAEAGSVEAEAGQYSN